MPVRSARKKSVVKLKTKKIADKKRVKRVLSMIGLTFFALVFLGGYSLLKLINHNLASALTPNEIGFTESGYPTLLYVQVKDLSDPTPTIQKIQFKIYDLDGQRVFSYDIPLDYEVDMPGRLGLEKLSNIFLVSDLNKTATTNSNSLEQGINELNKSLLPIFGLRAERYMVVDSSSSPKIEDFLKNGDLASFIDKDFILSLPKHLKSDFSTKELLKLGTFIGSLPSDRLINNPYLSSYIKDTEVIDQEVKDLMLLSPLSKEGYSVAILNGAGKEGFAAFGARVVSNNGGRVVAVNNSDTNINKSVLITDQQDSLTARKLAWLFGIDTVITKDQAKKYYRDNEIDRADIVVVLGFDLAETL